MASGYDDDNSFEDINQSKRAQKQTVKGEEFQMHLLEDQRSSAQRSWCRQLNKIENCLADLNEPDTLQSEQNFLESKMEILISAHERLTNALTDLEAKRAAQEKLEALEQEHSDALKRVNHKIAESKNERGSAISSRTGLSNLSSKGLRTTRSRTSNKTSRSSSTIDRKTETAVKLAKFSRNRGEKDIRFEEVPAY